jgi:mono/diheme cytochrome c family protein
MFSKILKWVGIVVGGLILIFAGFITYVNLALPNIEAEDITVDVTPERIVRGEYLSHHVMACFDCHSKRQTDVYSFPTDNDYLGGGAVAFDKKLGINVGSFYPANLTPFNLGDWTDGEIYRAIVNGVGKKGNALFPMMPYMNYSKLAKEDIYSVIAYLRTLEPVEADSPESEVTSFPFQTVMKLFFPQEAQHQDIPSKNDVLKYGEYIVTAASCSDCHTPMSGGKPVADSAFAGGFELTTITGKKIQSSNITPDKETGIGSWSKEYFLSRFAEYRDSTMQYRKLTDSDLHTQMPWIQYSGMTDEDINAIYTYLMSLKAIEKKINKVNY